MYQFMVTTTRSGSSFVDSGTGNVSLRATTGGQISTMSLTSSTNKWASRFVVALQLAAWSAVGIVLLEKGIASLQKHSLIKDAPRENNASRHQVLSETSADVLSVIPLVPIEVQTATAVSKDSELPDVPVTRRISLWSETTKVPMETKGMRSADDENTSTRVASTNDQMATENVRGEGNLETGAERINSIIESRKNEQSNILNGQRERNDGENKKEALDKSTNQDGTGVKRISVGVVQGHGNDVENPTKIPSSLVPVKVVLTNPEDSTGWSSSSRKRFRFGHVSGAGGSGAAAAVAMVAVGAVMLVLGPAVIVLRALDERRQERRFLKLSGEEDLPPSYEQATGSIEQAPTYSSLNLDTIS